MSSSWVEWLFSSLRIGDNAERDACVLNESMLKWLRYIRQEERHIDREILDIERKENKIKREVREALEQRKDVTSARLLAKELIHSRKSKERLRIGKSHLSALDQQLRLQKAVFHTTKAIEKSVEIMIRLNCLLKVPSLQTTFRDMQKEMFHHGLIESILNETLAEGEGEEGEEEEEKLVEQILQEILPSSSTIIAENKQKEEQEKELDELLSLTPAYA